MEINEGMESVGRVYDRKDDSGGTISFQKGT
jgi:hypothetical protein